MDPIWWVVIAVVVLAVLAFVLMQMRTRGEEAKRKQAAEVREEAQEHSQVLREREAHASQADAAARQARADAELKLVEAEKLESERASRGTAAAEARAEVEDKVRRADELDPDVDTGADDHRAGDRVGTRTDDTSLRGSDRVGSSDNMGDDTRHLGDGDDDLRDRTRRDV